MTATPEQTPLEATADRLISAIAEATAMDDLQTLIEALEVELLRHGFKTTPCPNGDCSGVEIGGLLFSQGELTPSPCPSA